MPHRCIFDVLSEGAQRLPIPALQCRQMGRDVELLLDRRGYARRLQRIAEEDGAGDLAVVG